MVWRVNARCSEIVRDEAADAAEEVLLALSSMVM